MIETRKREGQQLLLRFADGSSLKDRLQEVAKTNNRTLTQEILFRLESSLDAEGSAESTSGGRKIKLSALKKSKTQSELTQRVDALEARVVALEERQASD